ncbi:F-box protein At1g67340-like [Ananas comosus]|uniref:F-box protein At1g67340-like n=2 Tax=Ananas comosus TaxID=4615 RepID=A0A6P5EK06_ANACO|nr:F-box protein At1g67340-like [Ananas comosus]
MRRRRAHEEEEEGGAVRRTKRRRTNLVEMMLKPDDRRRKRRRTATATPAAGTDYFDALPDDLVLSVLSKLSSSASSPSDLISVALTCKRLNELGLQPQVLARASAKALAIRAKNWSESAHRFLKRCSDADNLEASYILGMIRFYCLEKRGSGAALMARAAMGSHAGALYALAIIQFNGSGGAKGDKDLRAGVALCARAAALGHVDALRELGHCLQDGYGVRRNVAEGRRFLVQANARELAAVLTATACCPLLSDFGWSVPPAEPHPANRFLAEWSAAGAGRRAEAGGMGLRMCSHAGCGRSETRRHEFRRCSVCGAVNYCSRACQALHWKLVHKADCTPMDRWLLDAAPAPAPEPAAPPAPAAPAADMAMG